MAAFGVCWRALCVCVSCVSPAAGLARRRLGPCFFRRIPRAALDRLHKGSRVRRRGALSMSMAVVDFSSAARGGTRLGAENRRPCHNLPNAKTRPPGAARRSCRAAERFCQRCPPRTPFASGHRGAQASRNLPNGAIFFSKFSTLEFATIFLYVIGRSTRASRLGDAPRVDFAEIDFALGRLRRVGEVQLKRALRSEI